ncbi:MAG: hypothetical protein R3E83_18780 [Burkholderiaceae bacterium]
MRTSEGTHFTRGETEAIARIEARIAAFAVPVENGEPLQILHHGVGGEHLAHHDLRAGRSAARYTVPAGSELPRSCCT